MSSQESIPVTRRRSSPAETPDPWGIDSGYEDANGKWRRVRPEIKRQLKAAMGTGGKTRPSDPGLRVINQGEALPLDREAELTLEDGTVVRVKQLPPDLPPGYHSLRPLRSRSAPTSLIVTPSRCFLPEELQAWGWALQLYSLRSAASWGMGDFADLREFCRWSTSEYGAGVIMTNPLNAAAPGIPQQASPYSPTSRIYRNPLYLRIAEVDGAREHLANFGDFERRGEELNREPLIDRDRIYRLKMDALDTLWRHVRERVEFRDYQQREDRQLRLFATYCAIAEQHGPNWREWPEQYRVPSDAAVSQFSDEQADRIRFHEWIQYLLDRQLADACTQPVIMQDLPIGVDPAGADAWAWQDLFAQGASVGAPPDRFNTQGQDWGLQPFVPHKLRSAHYEPFVKIVRAAMRHSAGLRIDHVMGLFRLYWIPTGAEKQHGTYVRYGADELLAILALESMRAGAFVVGEDLGTVEDGVREALAERGVLSYKVMWFEKEPPERYSAQALAAITTHDLPTIAGLWTGADLREQQEKGLQPNVEGTKESREQLKRLTGSDEDTPVTDVILRAHEALAQAPSAVIIAGVEDALVIEKRPNLPGTLSDQRPNWSMPLPKRFEEIGQDEFVKKVAEAMRAREQVKTSAEVA